MAEARATALRKSRALVVALVALLVGAVAFVSTAGSDAADEFVTRDGATLQVDGSTFRFVGFNLYDAAASDIYSCSPGTRLDDAGLDDAMRQVRDAGGTVVRFWAFQTYTAGGTDFSGVDRVLAAARDHDLRVMPVLEDGPGDCSTGEPGVPLAETGQGDWYSAGYREPLGEALVSYRDYVGQITRHYRDDPTIVAWSLVNEAETERRDEQGRTVLVDFARDVSAVAHEADPRHLVTLGTQSNGAPGTSGADFLDVYGLAGMDLTEVHDWGFYGDDEVAMPGAASGGELPDPEQCQAPDAQVACSFVLARQLGKPLVVGEAGITADSSDGRARRAQLLEAKIDAAFEAGASGYLVWQLNRTDTDGYGVVLGTDDPLFAVLEDAGETWATGPS